MMDHSNEQDSVIELVGPLQLALAAVALSAFWVADVLWRVLPLLQ